MFESYINGDALFSHILAIQDGSVSDTQRCLALLLKLDWDAMSSFEEQHRAKIISDYLKHESFLVLLDDVQEQDKHLDLASCGLPMPLRGRRKLIVTSRSQAGCSRMGCSEANTIEMKRLGDEDAWNLFKYNAGVEITEANGEVYKIAKQVISIIPFLTYENCLCTNLSDICKQMVSACEGLPRAIWAIGVGMAGATLCGTDLVHWWVAYEHFKSRNLPPERMEEILDML
jgi:hypothetical protein